MIRIIIPFCCIFFYSCGENKSDDNLRKLNTYHTDTVRLFSAIEKDSAYFINYQFKKQVNQSGVITYVYNSSDVRNFTIVCDTANKKYEMIGDKKDTTQLYFEGDRSYTVNGADYKVLKLVSDKGATDGEVSYFFNIDFGLLLNTSHTWRVGKILNPEKSNSEYLQLTVLLYKIFTEEEFFTTLIPESKIKFTPPKVE
ncbi:MAG: hypothetical protein KF862_26350 [Chitinophagaceae bacterium]|nr:hypothetical protein [Chitinophagaceae bacterium]